MLSLDLKSQADVIGAFNDTRYLHDIFNIDNPFCDTMFQTIHKKELMGHETLCVVQICYGLQHERAALY